MKNQMITIERTGREHISMEIKAKVALAKLSLATLLVFGCVLAAPSTLAYTFG